MKKQLTLIAGFIAVTAIVGSANNIKVENVILKNQDKAAKEVTVQFDMSWENSWRNTVNHDAAWVFMKFKAPGSNFWQHAYLSVEEESHKVPGGVVETGNSVIGGSDYVVGAFVYSATMNTGSVNYVRSKLRWNYGVSGYSFEKGEVIDISVHAIEMVYVPQGAFYLGSGGTEDGSFTDGGWDSGATLPFAVTSEAALTMTNAAGFLWGTASGTWNTIGPYGELIAAYPKGFNAFYCMKYGVTQGQYTEFLNLLTYAQQQGRTPVAPSQSAGTYLRGTTRHTIHITEPGVVGEKAAVYATETPYIACNYLTAGDAAAYADWAALRPMTELEFEKAGRGPAEPVPNEYAWGTTAIVSTGGEAKFEDLGLINERATQGNAIYSGSGPGGPIRAGIFATATSSREEAGASYWGIMELSGNLWERVISAGLVAGRTFDGSHGDGALAANGNSNAGWQGFSNRGGCYRTAAVDLQLSSRARGSTASAGTNHLDVGFRAVRTAQ